MAERQRDGAIASTVDPLDLLSLVLAMSLAWAPTSTTYTTVPDGGAGHAARRAALADAVRRAFVRR
jgi:hypothetical protein